MKGKNLLQQAEELANMGTWEVNLKKNEVKYSDQLLKMCGLETVSAKPSFDSYFEIYHPDDRLKAKQIIDTALKSGKNYEFEKRIVTANGEVKYILAKGEIERNEKNEAERIVGVFFDITTDRKTESFTKFSDARFHAVLDSLMEGCQIINFDWKYLYLNPSAAKQGRFSVNELLGKTMMEAYPGIENTELFDTLKKCMKDRKPKFIENKFTYNDGNIGYFELRIEPVNEGLFVLSIDISERKIAEEKIQKLYEELEAKVLERTQQLEATNKELDSFCYSVSHDLRAPLRAVDGYASMLVEDYTPVLDGEGLRLLNNVQYNAKKMGTLIDDLLAFSRLGRKEVQKTEINMNELVEGVFIEYHKTTTHNAEVIIKDLHPCIADYGLVHQVFANLISNALKYSSKKEKPVVEITSKKVKDEIVYSIKDNGAGFNMKYAHKLFGVFQRLHTMEEFEGTGVGLAIVQRIINKHGGKVWAIAEVDKGATFSFSLPKI